MNFTNIIREAIDTAVNTGHLHDPDEGLSSLIRDGLIHGQVTIDEMATCLTVLLVEGQGPRLRLRTGYNDRGDKRVAVGYVGGIFEDPDTMKKEFAWGEGGTLLEACIALHRKFTSSVILTVYELAHRSTSTKYLCPFGSRGHKVYAEEMNSEEISMHIDFPYNLEALMQHSEDTIRGFSLKYYANESGSSVTLKLRKTGMHFVAASLSDAIASACHYIPDFDMATQRPCISDGKLCIVDIFQWKDDPSI
jgi:hypothetical protein